MPSTKLSISTASDSARSRLAAEVARLDDLLRPAPQDHIAHRVKILFAALQARDKAGGEELRASAYVMALAAFSVETLDGVVRDVLDGGIPDLDPVFVPTPPQLARACREREQDRKAELCRRRMELRDMDAPPVRYALPKPPDPAVERRIAAGLSALKTEDSGGGFPKPDEIRRWGLPAGAVIVAAHATVVYPGGRTVTWGELRRGVAA